ncbi:hypothetical protein [Rhodopirellula sp. MGV]|uniref:hypothetical protein n=1 Tax=Rhodopirellula sp. MGV TaxID=2023130 RepID=UPI001E58DDF9|nr:hypothetical protein [Rhodopirellula sp. MGV]
MQVFSTPSRLQLGHSASDRAWAEEIRHNRYLLTRYVRRTTDSDGSGEANR